MSKKIALVTGGGDCPGLNAVIRAAVLTGAEKYGWEFFGVEDALNGLVDLDYQSPHGNLWLTPKSVRDILRQGGTILGTSNKSDPFNYVVKDGNGKTTTIDISDKVVENFKKVGLDAMISIGGDGSMRISRKFMDKGIPIVGVPKTIDNDLEATDQTFGFDTALHVATDALDRLRDTAQSHDRVMVCEVMGRNAGWIALHAGIAGGADAIILPEMPYRLGPIAKKIQWNKEHGKTHSLIVVSEGARPVDGEESVLEHKAGEMPRLMGAAQRFAHGLEQLTEFDIRVTVLGHIQRGGSPTPYDRILGTRFGHHAAELVEQEKYGRMVALKGLDIVDVSMEDATRGQKLVSPDSQAIQTARSIGVIFGDES